MPFPAQFQRTELTAAIPSLLSLPTPSEGVAFSRHFPTPSEGVHRPFPAQFQRTKPTAAIPSLPPLPTPSEGVQFSRIFASPSEGAQIPNRLQSFCRSLCTVYDILPIRMCRVKWPFSTTF